MILAADAPVSHLCMVIQLSSAKVKLHPRGLWCSVQYSQQVLLASQSTPPSCCSVTWPHHHCPPLSSRVTLRVCCWCCNVLTDSVLCGFVDYFTRQGVALLFVALRLQIRPEQINLTRLVLQSRFGDKPIGIRGLNPQTGTAVREGLSRSGSCVRFLSFAFFLSQPC